MRCNGRPCSSLEDIIIYASLVGIQFSYAGISVLLGNEISKGRSPLPVVVCAYGLGACVLCPFAFFLDKERRCKMNLGLLAQVLLISLTGVSAYQALLLTGMGETSPAFACAVSNLTPAIIFAMAWTLGMEKVDIKRAHSQFKIGGTLICLCGTMAMSFISGPALMKLTSLPSVPHSQQNASPVNIIVRFLQEGNSGKRIRGCIYLLAAVISFSCSMVLQAKALNKYPAPLSLTTMTNLFGSMEIGILVMIVDKGIHRASWVFDGTGVVTIIYGGLVCHGFAFALQFWCVQKRGPVFVAIFNPVSTVCSTILSSIFLGEALHVGSAMGMLLIFGGLYVVLWGKSKDGVDEGVMEHLNNGVWEAGHFQPLLS